MVHYAQRACVGLTQWMAPPPEWTGWLGAGEDEHAVWNGEVWPEIHRDQPRHVVAGGAKGGMWAVTMPPTWITPRVSVRGTVSFWLWKHAVGIWRLTDVRWWSAGGFHTKRHGTRQSPRFVSEWEKYWISPGPRVDVAKGQPMPPRPRGTDPCV